MNKNLNEGFKFGRKEKSQIEQNLNRFAIGIEFEFHLNNNGNASTLEGENDTQSLIDAYSDGNLSKSTSPDIDYDFCVFEIDGSEYGLYKQYDGRLYEISSLETQVDSVSEFFSSDAFDDIGEYFKSLSTIIANNYKSFQQDSLFDDSDEVIDGLEEKLSSLDTRYDMIETITAPEVQHLFTGLYDRLNLTEGLLYIITNKTINKNTLEESLLFVKYVRELEEKDVDLNEYFEEIINDYLEALGGDDPVNYAIGISEHFDTPILYYDADDTTAELPDVVSNNLTAIEDEHNNQVEVVTDTVNIPTGIAIIEEMFDYIKENGSTSDSSGMHISISIDDVDSVNLVKFLILMEMGYIVDDVFPEREYVNDIDEIFSKTISRKIDDYIFLDKINYKMSNQEILEKVVTLIKSTSIFDDKYQSIKFGDYEIHNGRIELRFFGGKEYEYRYDEISQHIFRALYVLLVSSNDYKQKEYMKGLYKKIFDNIPREALVAMRLSRLYDTGKIKTGEEYNKFIDSEVRKAKRDGYRLSKSDIARLARYNGDTVSMDIMKKYTMQKNKGA